MKKRRFGTERRASWDGAAVLVAALVLAGAAGCGTGSASEGGFTLTSATVERRTIESTVEASGTVEPVKVVEVKSLASGEILEMPVELGDDVEQGALLIRIDPRDERNELEQAEADLGQARAALDVAQSRLDRIETLRGSGIATIEEVESAVLEHANARSEFIKAETRLELARERIQDAEVRAPIAGTIVEKLVEEGQVITSVREVTGGTTLLRMADLDEVRVRTLVDESDIGRIQPGFPAAITVEAYPSRTFRGDVLMIEPKATVEENVTMFAVLTRISNEDGLLRPGMNADVRIVLGRREGVLALPNAGVKLPDEARRLAEALGLAHTLPEAPSGRRRTMRGARNGASAERGMGSGVGADAAAAGADASPSRQAFVFRRTPQGRLTLEQVSIGLSSWEYTEIVAGLEEDEEVVQVPLALIQQEELLDRFRSRSAVPGMSRD